MFLKLIGGKMKTILILNICLFTIILSVDSETANNLDTLEASFTSERGKFLETGKSSPEYDSLIEKYRMKRNSSGAGSLSNSAFSLDGSEENNSAVCRLVFDYVLNLIRYQGGTESQLRDELVALCYSFNLAGHLICSKFIDLNIATIFYILDSRPRLTAETICRVILQSGTSHVEDPLLDFSVDISPGGNPITQSKSAAPGAGPNNVKIIHITDIHYSPLYSPGSNAECNEYACCRITQGMAPVDNLTAGAGAWGDYRYCDSPWSAVEDMLDHVQNNHPDANLIYFTGNIVGNGIWESSISDNKAVIKKVFFEMAKRFSNATIIPVIGNHEAHPINSFAPSYVTIPDLSNSWLYDFQHGLWQSVLSVDVMKSIQEDGYYSALVRPGLRIIVLNNNLAHIYNPWVLYSTRYLQKQLQWLNDVLYVAEQEGEKVHLLYHIPNGAETMFVVWAREFRLIVERYWETISVQFNGHSHLAEAYIFYSKEHPEYAINCAFSGGSTSTFSNLNPNYNVYLVDDANYELQEITSFYYNLTNANLSPLTRPVWTELFNTPSFGLQDMSPASLDALVLRFASNPTLLYTYWTVKMKQADPYLDGGCDAECLQQHLCEFATTEFIDQLKCNELSAIFAAHQE